MKLDNLYGGTENNEQENKENNVEEVDTQEANLNSFLKQGVGIKESEEVDSHLMEKATPPDVPSGYTSFKVKGDASEGNTLIDEFILNLNEYYQPPEMENYDFLRNVNHELYTIQVDQDSIEESINMAFDMNPNRVSFSTEELNLHNRLTGLTGVTRNTERYVVVKTDKGDVVVAKRTTREDSQEHVNVILDEIKDKLRRGERVEINLLEPYKFKDSHDIEIERYRYRLAFNEIKEVIATTRMKGIITGDSFLVIHE